MEICTILDLIAEFKTDKELEEMELDSDSEMTSDPFDLSFFKTNISSNELDKIKKIKAEIMGVDKNDEKKPKRKLAKKPKLAEDLSISADPKENILIDETEISDVNIQ